MTRWDGGTDLAAQCDIDRVGSRLEHGRRIRPPHRLRERDVRFDRVHHVTCDITDVDGEREIGEIPRVKAQIHTDLDRPRSDIRTIHIDGSDGGVATCCPCDRDGRHHEEDEREPHSNAHGSR